MQSAAPLFRALSDPTRLALFETIARKERTVSELTERFHVTQPAISQHLTALKECGLVSGRKQGRFVYYRAEPDGVKPLVNWLNHYRRFWQERLPRLDALLKDLPEERER